MKNSQSKQGKVYKQSKAANSHKSEERERLGRHPFMAKVNQYLVDRSNLAKSTRELWRWRYKHLAKIFRELKADGKIDTLNPKKFGKKEINAYIEYMNDIGLEPSTKAGNISLLNNLLTYCDNFELEKLKKKDKNGLSFTAKNEIKTLTFDEIYTIHEASKKIQGWNGSVAKFITLMFPFTGIRNQELRLAHVEDININEWTFWVRHPKGENTYGRKRIVYIPEPIRPIVNEYLEERRKHLEKAGEPNIKPLIPSVKNSKNNYFYTHEAFYQMRRRLGELSGISFKIKDYRASFAQMLMDNGERTETISYLMGHANCDTTNRFYARIKKSSALKNVNKTWDKVFNDHPQVNSTSRNRIRTEESIPGYA